LRSNLLVAKRRGDRIIPGYAELGGNSLELASQIIKSYSEALGSKKRELNVKLSELEEWTTDYRFVRGLATLLDRRCQMETKTSVNPTDLRRLIFQASAETGLPTSEEERRLILARVSNETGLGLKEIEEAFFGDLDDEMFIVNFNAPDPISLLREYNMGITQTLLFNASEMSFTVSGNWQSIFRQIKRLGLIYTVTKENANYQVKIDGPTSLFKLSRRYGISMAKLLPYIASADSWRIQSKVVSPTRKILLNLDLDSTRQGNYIRGLSREEERSFDSSAEEDFAIRFDSLKTGWKLTREPGPLPVGHHVMLPDFLIQLGDLRVYLEIMGFWSNDYLVDKLRKLEAVKEVDLIVAVDRRLACKVSSKRLEHLSLIYYKNKVPLKPVLTHLEKKEKTLTYREAETIVGAELKLTAPVVEMEVIAGLLGVSTESVKVAIENISIPGYLKLGDLCIQKTFLEKIDTAIQDRLTSERLSFGEAVKLIESLGGKNPSTILEILGYRTIWRGIIPELAEIVRRNTEPIRE
jgi:predicted nuclease of restriction endonuclease-like RecB superfamily